MENATQALLIAAGVLIGVLILSLGVYLFNIFGEISADAQSKVDANEIAQFNAKFLQYVGRTDLTIHDVITAKNYALEHNNKFVGYKIALDRAGDNNDYIDVFWWDRRLDEGWKDAILNLVLYRTDKNLLAPNGDVRTTRFSCEVEINNNTGRVNKIYFVFEE